LNKIDLDFNFIDLNNIECRINFVAGKWRPAFVAIEPLTESLPAWLAVLDQEDLGFLKRFLLCSGSLKALAEEYAVSYPTVRARLDRLIAKVQAAEDPKITDPFERKLLVLVADGKIPIGLGKELLRAHREVVRRRTEK
jgi:hypothetical protein